MTVQDDDNNSDKPDAPDMNEVKRRLAVESAIMNSLPPEQQFTLARFRLDLTEAVNPDKYINPLTTEDLIDLCVSLHAQKLFEVAEIRKLIGKEWGIIRANDPRGKM